MFDRFKIHNKKAVYLRRDVQGTITGLIDKNNNLVEEYSYDAWGRRRNPTDWTYDSVPQPQLLYRGYTMHEMLDEFGLINMNGRCYDPVVGRFLSPDIIVQNPNNTQCYNRYSYCINNPLKYSDPSGWSWTPIQAARHASMMANTMMMRLRDNFQPSVIRSGSSSMGNGYLFGSNAIAFQTTIATFEMELAAIGKILSSVFGMPGLFGNPGDIGKIDISGYSAQQFSEAFLGVCAYERFFGDGKFKMDEYFGSVSSEKTSFSFQGEVIMNRGSYEYSSFINANFKLSEEVDLNNITYSEPVALTLNLSGVLITPDGAPIESQDQDILSFTQSWTVRFSGGIDYLSFNSYGGTLHDYFNSRTAQLTNDGCRLVNGIRYRFDLTNINSARYCFNNYGTSFGYNWWYRY